MKAIGLAYAGPFVFIFLKGAKHQMNEEIKWPEITKDTPMPELKRIHQMIWDYAIRYGRKPVTPYRCDCIACEYDRIQHGVCSKCPIIWPENIYGARTCINEGLFDRWEHAKGDERTALAKQIRDLPWKFELGENYI